MAVFYDYGQIIDNPTTNRQIYSWGLTILMPYKVQKQLFSKSYPIFPPP